MLKKIKVTELKKGMHIVNMDRSWIDHPFLTKKKTITSDSQIIKLIEYGITEVYIDTDIGVDVDEQASLPPQDLFEKFNLGTIDSEIGNNAPAHVPTLVLPLEPVAPFREEIKKARVIQREALTVVKDFMSDVRVGKNIEPERAMNVVNAMIDSIFRNQEALFSLTRIKDYDDYTFVHCINVCVLSLAIGRQLNFGREDLQDLGVGALLHDLGKMKISKKILNKPGKLTQQEYDEIKRHPEYGMEILERSHGISIRAKLISLQHHERHDGSGYPLGLTGEKIDRYSQLVAVVDVYDAITSVRCYSKGMTPHEGVKKIYQWGQKDFNKEMVEKFIQAVGIYPVGTLVQMDTGEIGVVLSINPENLVRPRVIILYQNDQSRLETPLEVDLLEKSSPPENYARSILKPLNPQKWDINVRQFLPGAM